MMSDSNVLVMGGKSIARIEIHARDGYDERVVNFVTYR